MVEGSFGAASAQYTGSKAYEGAKIIVDEKTIRVKVPGLTQVNCVGYDQADFSFIMFRHG